jgi:ABC-2 type transport system ATP-binding protein
VFLILNNQEIISINNLKKYFDEVRAVDGISFKIKEGEVFGLLGPNGAGKTTAIKLILGLLEPTEGKIFVFNKEVKDNRILIKQNIGYVAEDPLIYKFLTLEELFNFISSIRNLDEKQTSRDLTYYIESFGLKPFYKELIDNLSHGNKQKVQIITSVLHKPKLIILDEPFSGLDPQSIKIVKEILKLQIERGVSILFSTHILDYAQEICDRICIIDKGKIVGIGTLNELKQELNDLNSDLEDIFLKLTKLDVSIEKMKKKWRKQNPRMKAN